MGSIKLADGQLVAADGRLRLTIDASTGGIRQVENLETGHELLASADPAPWRMTPQGATFGWDDANLPTFFQPDAPVPAPVEIETDGESAELRWSAPSFDLAVSVTLRFGGPGEIELWPRVTVGEDQLPPESFTYPVLAKPQPLSPTGEADQLVFPYHSGWLVRDPLALEPQTGMYPEGNHGCATQLTAYLEPDVGGFYVATHDPHSTSKHLTFGADEWNVQHETWDLRHGTDLDYDYPVVIAALDEGDWYEAAERYREWALAEAPWTDPPAEPGDADPEERRWLHDEVGLALWGPPSSLDWSEFYEFYANVAGTPLHVCSGWDWPAELPQGRSHDGWFPADLHPANVEAWADHHVTPYTNDLFVSTFLEDFYEVWEPALLFPYSSFSFHHFSRRYPGWSRGEAFLDNRPEPDPVVLTNANYVPCPATAPQRDLHAWRASTMVRDYPLAGACYDISSGMPSYVSSECWRDEHGHPPGKGRAIVRAYDELNRHSRAVTREETGEYLVQGVETMAENVIGSLDFYVARAGAGPHGVLETWRPAPEEPPGEGRELIPLFDAIYHDIGPVRHDGWLTLRDDQGDLWFWLAARIVLRWGALLSLEYALQPPERPPGYEGGSAVIDWGGATLEFDDLPEADPAKLSFVRELATARTELAGDYLGHGRLLRPLPLDPDPVTLAFEQHSLWWQMPGVTIADEWTVPSVVHGAWEAPDGRVGILLAAIGEEGRSVSTEVDASTWWGRTLAGQPVAVRTGSETVEAGTVGADDTVRVDMNLDPRTVTLVEIGG